MQWLANPDTWVALATLTALEVVLGIDNIILITILVGRLPVDQRAKARTLGLGLAMATRILLLLTLTWVMSLTTPLFAVLGMGFSGRDLIVIGGGLFLLAKSVHEIHNSLEGDGEEHDANRAPASFTSVLIQIAVIDIIFSLDSVITAVGLVGQVEVMIIAVVLSVLLMMFAARSIGNFVESHPTVKMLALAFLILVGFTLVAEGFEFHVPKGYVYFAMAFSIGVEMLNIRAQKKRRAGRAPVQLRRALSGERTSAADEPPPVPTRSR